MSLKSVPKTKWNGFSTMNGQDFQYKGSQGVAVYCLVIPAQNIPAAYIAYPGGFCTLHS